MIRREAEVSMREIAKALGASHRRLAKRAAREGWPWREQGVRGGRRRLYRVSALPADIRESLGFAGAPEGEAAASPEALNAPSTATETPLTTASTCDKMSQSVPPDRARALLERYESLPESRRAAARAKLAALDAAIAVSKRERIPLRAACERAEGYSAATLTAAWRAARGLPAQLRAAALADRRWSGRGRPLAKVDPDAWEAFKADYLRAERPGAAACHRRLARLASAKGWTIPKSPKALLRRLEAEVPPGAIVLARQGPEASKGRVPPQIRDREALASMQVICCDGHAWDVRVQWPDGSVGRPVMVAWQCVRSGEILGWRIDRSESAEAYRLSMADTLWAHGAPEHVVADNGRGICSQVMTGGAESKFRGKARAEGDPDPEVRGLLTELVGEGNVHFTIPYSGRSKQIERAFRDFCEDIARDPRLAGFYSGPGPERKPHDYDHSKGVAPERFRAIVAEGIALHNSRPGRRGQGMDGRSCDEVFAACKREPFGRKLSPEQLSRWLLAPAVVTARASDGSVEVSGARYWSQELADAFAFKPKGRRKAVVRADPQRLDRPARVELPDGRLVAVAEPLGRVPYLDAEAAAEAGKARSRALRADREALKAHRALDAAGLGALLDEAAPELPEPPNVLEMEFEAPDPDPGREEEERVMREAEERTLALALGGGLIADD